ncbi:calcyclin-binding protein [Planococcus citri]|uniref:calcyclin-binding protein n=1 Tax=Planococcus citri TaxID=170843 RepID=UPI0031F90431
MSSRVETLRNDVAELYRLADLTDRKKIKDILSIEAKKIETEISLLQEKENTIQPSSTTVTTSRRTYDIKITTYAWDQTNQTVKIFVTLPNVHTIPSENIICTFTETSFDLLVKELEGKNHTLSVKNLFQSIKPEESSWKVKTGMVVVSLAKKGSSDTKWSGLTKTAKDTTTPKPPKMDDDADPSAGVMNLLKQMYMDGDDDMKRTIAKAWTENREKNGMNLGF